MKWSLFQLKKQIKQPIAATVSTLPEGGFLRCQKISMRSNLPHRLALAAGCDWAHPKMTSPKSKAKKKPPKDSVTLLPCFYFVEVGAGGSLNTK